MPKYTHAVTLDNGQNVTFSTPVKLSYLEIYQRAVQEEGIKSGRIPTTKTAGYLKEDFKGMADVVTNPELVAGAASLVPGVGTATAGAIGAGTSVVRDLSQGETDPKAIAGRAAIHGMVNMIPGAVGSMVAAKQGATVAGMAADAMSGGKVSTVKALMSALGIGQKQAARLSAFEMKQGLKASTLEIADGVPLVSYQGLQVVKGKLADLAVKGKAFGDPEFDALNALVTRITASIEGGFVGMGSLAKQGGITATNAAERTAMAAKAAAADAAATATSAGVAAKRKVWGALSGGSLLTLSGGDE